MRSWEEADVKAFLHLWRESKRLARDDGGAALLLTLAVFLLLFVICCGVFSIGETIRQKVELQNACDAAAYSAAVAQADGLSRMAVVNRAMAWTYIQLCRAQMDYIVFSWLKILNDRFVWDLDNKCATWDGKTRRGRLWEGKHYNFEDISEFIESFLRRCRVWNVYQCGLSCRDKNHGKEGYGWYIGVGETPAERKMRAAYLNGWNDFAYAKRVRPPDDGDADCIGAMLDGMDNGNDGDGEPGGAGGIWWKQAQAERIQFLKKTLRELNGALLRLQLEMNLSIKKSIETVVEDHLPKKPDGTRDEEAAKDFYLMRGGGTCPSGPEAYFGPTDTPGYFKGVLNTEEDELQFLSMAGGVPSRRADAPEWMKERPVLLSDWFGADDNPTEKVDGIRRFVAGGLDQWYVRAGASECENSFDIPVPHMPLALDSLQTPGGIRRVYKNSNREDERVWRIRWHHRPNHVFCGDISAIGRMRFSECKEFFNLRGTLDKILPGQYAATALIAVSSVFTGGATAAFTEFIQELIKEAVGGMVEEAISSVVSKLSSNLFDIPPSDGHTRMQTPDQCENVNEAIGLVAEYEWASAYWLCPWKRVRRFSFRRGFYWKEKSWHYRIPVAEFKGCAEHGYGEWLSWVPEEVEVLLRGGSSRKDYRSCFINFDGTRDMERNTHLRGYVRIYGDDKDCLEWKTRNRITGEEFTGIEGYVGEAACPWLLDESFFHGDGTILVGLARKQRNPFLRAFGNLLETVEKPSFYSPFGLEGKNGRDRYVVAMSAARAAFSPRPAGGDGTGSVNDETKGAPGNYEVKYDGVCDHKMHLRPWEEIPGTRVGCACNDADNTERLARGWNLSQTDWDATLLPLRFASARHSAFDSFRPQAVSWEKDEDGLNGTSRLLTHLRDAKWEQCGGGEEIKSYDEILAVPPVPGETGGETESNGDELIYRLLYRRKIL